jgi:CDP-4-dehydro-6-deoxyglucose reductase
MTIRFEGSSFVLSPDETVLEGIERSGASLPSFCRRGVCQTCMLKATRGEVPAAAQKGLRDGLRKQGVFLACVCKPTGDLDIVRHEVSERFASRVESVELLSADVLRVWITAPAGLVYEAGQYLQLERPGDGLMRPYSIASLPGGEHIELHVALLQGGAMSGWLRTAVGEHIGLRGPFGECFYLPEEPERSLCLAGTGTGLAPLLGVLRAAIAAGHRGPIRLFHGSVRRAGLYLWAELEALLVQMPQLRLVGSLLDGGALEAPASASEPSGSQASAGAHDRAARCRIQVGSLDALLLAEREVWTEQRVYLCGHEDLVRKLEKKLYLAGVPLARIHADPFVAPGARADRSPAAGRGFDQPDSLPP